MRWKNLPDLGPMIRVSIMFMATTGTEDPTTKKSHGLLSTMLNCDKLFKATFQKYFNFPGNESKGICPFPQKEKEKKVNYCPSFPNMPLHIFLPLCYCSYHKSP